MKLTTVVLALFSSVALAAPAAQMDKRAVVDATVAVDGLRYRTCPKTTCSAPGQYPKGTKIKLSCYTTSGTTEVNGDKRWAKVSGGVGNGRWVSLAYMDWPGTISGC